MVTPSTIKTTGVAAAAVAGAAISRTPANSAVSPGALTWCRVMTAGKTRPKNDTPTREKAVKEEPEEETVAGMTTETAGGMSYGLMLSIVLG